MRLAHISDLHFSSLNFGLSQFFSKRWVGNLNFLLSRKNNYLTDQLLPLPELFKYLGVTHVAISGDLSTTSQVEEFKRAAAFIDALRATGADVFVVPGNHDHYTKKASKKKLFYEFFDPNFSEKKGLNLKDHRVVAKQIDETTWIIGLDTALATSLTSSKGLFSQEMELHLETALSQIPHSHRVILLNHFPLFHHENPRKTLLRAGALKEQIKCFPQIKLYLHGHTHRHCIADLRNSNYPVILDSGSAVHRKWGSWNLIDLDKTTCTVTVFNYKNGLWQNTSQKRAFCV